MRERVKEKNKTKGGEVENVNGKTAHWKRRNKRLNKRNRKTERVRKGRKGRERERES